MKTLDARLVCVPVSQAKETGEDVQGLADSMLEFGQGTLIPTDAHGNVLKGNRRLLAAKLNGLDHLLGLRLPLEGIEAEQAVIESQLVNRSQTVLKRAELFVRWKEIYETKFPEVKNGGNTKKKSQSDKLAFWEFANHRTGINRRTIMRLVKIGKGIPSDARLVFHSVPIGDHLSDLELMAKETDKDAVVDAAFLIENDTSLKPVVALRMAKRERNNKKKSKVKLTTDSYQLLHGDAIEEMKKMDSESFDAIITDPPWKSESLNLLEPSAEQYARLLKPGGVCLVMFGQAHLDVAIAALSKHLTYNWLLVDDQGDRGEDKQNSVRIFSHFKPVLRFSKGTYSGVWMPDVYRGVDGKGSRKSKEWHEWGQSPDLFEWLVAKHLPPDPEKKPPLILEPFCGGGTTVIAALRHKCRIIAIDDKKENIELTRRRIDEAFPKLAEPDKPKLLAKPMRAAG